MLKLFIEALVVGLVVVLMGYPSSFVALKILPMGEGDDHRPIMYLSLFITGIASHFLFEALRLNKWYCTNGFACTK